MANENAGSEASTQTSKGKIVEGGASQIGSQRPNKKAVNRSSKKGHTKKSKSSRSNASGKREAVRRPFPQNSLQESLTVPQAVKDKNGGQPFDTVDVAAAFKLSRTAKKFFYLVASSRDYGLTSGSRDTDSISLTDLGRSIVYPESAEQQRQDRIKAFFTVPLFKEISEYYSGGDLPEKQFVSSVLFKKGLDESLHDDFCDLYNKNRRFLGIFGPNSLQIVKGEESGDAVVLAQPGDYSHRAFLIMPFSEKGRESRPAGFFDEVMDSLIKPACNAADFGVETARSLGSDVIHHTIVRQLEEADLVVADLTDHNPNVLFELGIRIALDKPVLLIRAKGTPPIFDVDQMMRVCEYDPRLWKTTIQSDITTMTDHVKGAWDSREKNPSYMGILKTGQQSTPAIARNG